MNFITLTLTALLASTTFVSAQMRTDVGPRDVYLIPSEGYFDPQFEANNPEGTNDEILYQYADALIGNGMTREALVEHAALNAATAMGCQISERTMGSEFWYQVSYAWMRLFNAVFDSAEGWGFEENYAVRSRAYDVAMLNFDSYAATSERSDTFCTLALEQMHYWDHNPENPLAWRDTWTVEPRPLVE